MVHLKWHHNHELKSQENLHYKKPSEETRCQLDSLIAAGVHSTTMVKDMVLDKILSEAASEDYADTADGSLNPNYEFIRR